MHDDPFEHGHYGADNEAVFGPPAADGWSWREGMPVHARAERAAFTPAV